MLVNMTRRFNNVGMSEKYLKAFEVPLGMPDEIFWAHEKGAALRRVQWILENIEPSSLEQAFKLLPARDDTIVELFAQTLTQNPQREHGVAVIESAREILARTLPDIEVLTKQLGAVATIETVNILFGATTGFDLNKILKIDKVDREKS